jgi:hypothetical protein
MTEYLDIVNRTKVSPELLIEIVQMHTAMAAEERPIFARRAFRTFELLHNKGVRGRQAAALVTAIDIRLRALARLQQDVVLRAWLIPGRKPGSVSINRDALKVAADEPLIENEQHQAVFDAGSFRRRLLAIMEPAGRA